MSYRHKKHFGQHFLHDGVLINQLVQDINPNHNDIFLEVGPGGGALTFPLLKQLPHLFAVEVDKDCATYLTNKTKPNQLTIFNQDILKFDLQTVKADQLIRVVGNLPYNISTPLLFHLYQQNELVEDYHVMVQLEVAERICADVGDKQYGRLSVMSQYYCEPVWLCDIGPESFDPPPKVDSAFIRLIPKRDRDTHIEKTLSKVVTTAFNQRRKTITNSLKTLINAQALQSLNIDLKARAENLSLADYESIAHYLLANESA